MITFCQEHLDKYKENDWIAWLMKENTSPGEEQIRTNEWMENMENKRFIYSIVYGELLSERTQKKVLDVGGGYSSLTKVLAANSEYTLLDFMAHGGEEHMKENAKKHNINWINADWYNAELDDQYDVVIANDIFPDVDQRMELFIDEMLPRCKELRLVLTYYNIPRFYTTKRMDDSEILTFLSWDGEITALKLMKYKERLIDTSEKDLREMQNDKTSIFRNGRQVSYVVLRGERL